MKKQWIEKIKAIKILKYRRNIKKTNKMKRKNIKYDGQKIHYKSKNKGWKEKFLKKQ